jgi:hypothetical protein
LNNTARPSLSVKIVKALGINVKTKLTIKNTAARMYISNVIIEMMFQAKCATYLNPNLLQLTLIKANKTNISPKTKMAAKNAIKTTLKLSFTVSFCKFD